MRAVVKRGTRLVLDDVADLTPGPGQALVRTLACGICGSDLHMLHHMEHMLSLGRRAGAPPAADPAKDIVMGHEFSCEVVDYGPGSDRKIKTGSTVVSVPVNFGPAGVETVGYSNRFPGGYAEQMLLFEPMLIQVPNGLAADHAALTEPFAVGLHAVNKAQMDKDSVALVIGCGPVGLAVIAALKAKALGPIHAADFSAARRRLAESYGADVVIDPAAGDPHAMWSALGVPTNAGEVMATMMSGAPVRRPVIFECVGVPGLIQSLIDAAPVHARIVVVGVCMETDRIEPGLAVTKEIELRFVLGYSPEEFAHTLRQLAEGEIPAAPILTGEVGLGGVAQAFEDLKSPQRHAKILVKPGLASQGAA
jgi:threonine dehydrogenase-like Zn-dependent dehydrogenase